MYDSMIYAIILEIRSWQRGYLPSRPAVFRLYLTTGLTCVICFGQKTSKICNIWSNNETIKQQSSITSHINTLGCLLYGQMAAEQELTERVYSISFYQLGYLPQESIKPNEGLRCADLNTSQRCDLVGLILEVLTI